MTGPGSADARTFKLASILLQYPTAAIFEGLDELDAAAASLSPRRTRELLAGFILWLRLTPPTEVAEHYVHTFDLRRRCALYLTYYRTGDTRKRGMAMLAFKAAYRGANFIPSEEELPDYLPLVLEFASLTGAGAKLLRNRRADLELLRRALADAGTPYLGVIDAVLSQLPGMRRRDDVIVKNHWENGPPHEEVGLEPFAPPEYLSGMETRR